MNFKLIIILRGQQVKRVGDSDSGKERGKEWGIVGGKGGDSGRQLERERERDIHAWVRGPIIGQCPLIKLPQVFETQYVRPLQQSPPLKMDAALVQTVRDRLPLS